MTEETNTELLAITDENVIISTKIRLGVFDPAPTEHIMIISKSDLRKIIDSVKEEKGEN